MQLGGGRTVSGETTSARRRGERQHRGGVRWWWRRLGAGLGQQLGERLVMLGRVSWLTDGTYTGGGGGPQFQALERVDLPTFHQLGGRGAGARNVSTAGGDAVMDGSARVWRCSAANILCGRSVVRRPLPGRDGSGHNRHVQWLMVSAWIPGQNCLDRVGSTCSAYGGWLAAWRWSDGER